MVDFTVAELREKAKADGLLIGRDKSGDYRPADGTRSSENVDGKM